MSEKSEALLIISRHNSHQGTAGFLALKTEYYPVLRACIAGHTHLIYLSAKIMHCIAIPMLTYTGICAQCIGNCSSGTIYVLPHIVYINFLWRFW